MTQLPFEPGNGPAERWRSAGLLGESIEPIVAASLGAP